MEAWIAQISASLSGTEAKQALPWLLFGWEGTKEDHGCFAEAGDGIGEPLLLLSMEPLTSRGELKCFGDAVNTVDYWAMQPQKEKVCPFCREML